MVGMGPWYEPDQSEVARVSVLVAALKRIAAFKAKHPELRIQTPSETLSRNWEVTGPDGITQYDNPDRMIDRLELRYPE
jgi:hypothetical protein